MYVLEGHDAVKLTLEVLHQSVLQKVPMCAFARVGGDDGARISRAAFAIMLKFTENIAEMTRLVKNVNSAADGLTETDGVQKLKAIISKLKEDEDFLNLSKRWEAACQMRKWTQSIKLAISERTALEADESLRKTWNEANPS